MSKYENKHSQEDWGKMIWHIAKRELYDNMTSLRFALAILLLLTLMVVNAVNHQGFYKTQIAQYRKNVAESLNVIRDRTDTLYTLVLNGPGVLYKKPSPLHFWADGGEAFLSSRAIGAHPWNSYPAAAVNEKNEKEIVEVRTIWRFDYPQSNASLRNFSPPFMKIDGTFIIGYVLSFVAILFTFDAISGERERGTLRLILANNIPRDIVLAGKFLGALISIGLPFLIAALVNLVLLSISGSIQLGASEWGRLVVILLLAMLYVSIFLALGLLISARTQQSSVSLMVLLLIWTVFVVLTPATLGSIARDAKPTMTRDEYHSRRLGLRDLIHTNFPEVNRYPLTREIPPTRTVSVWSESFRKEAEGHERLNEEHLKAQISQIQFARNITRISPSAIVQYAVESLAGTGLSRHIDFLDQVHQYSAEFRRFLVETDAADPESPHAIGVRYGTSEKPVNFEAIPKFEDHITFSNSLNAAIMDILLLILFLVVVFAGAFLSFLRVDI